MSTLENRELSNEQRKDLSRVLSHIINAASFTRNINNDNQLDKDKAMQHLIGIDNFIKQAMSIVLKLENQTE